MLNVELSIVMVLHNSASSLTTCLRSIAPTVDSGLAELIAVDNASPDESVDILRRELPQAILVELRDNRGFAAGANAALTRARGRYWIVLNPDVIAAPGGLRALVEFMDRHPGIGLASPELYGEDGQWEAPGRATPSVVRTLFEMSRLHRLLPRRLRGRLLGGGYWPGGEQLNVGWIPATAVVVRPQAAGEVGLMREDFFMYGEDLEWCWRMRNAGWGIGVCDTARFAHAQSSSAIRTFGATERQRRIALGTYRACQVMYGPRRARLIAAVTAGALMLEAAAPGRAPEYRHRTRHAARIWRGIAQANERWPSVL